MVGKLPIINPTSVGWRWWAFFHKMYWIWSALCSYKKRRFLSYMSWFFTKSSL